MQHVYLKAGQTSAIIEVDLWDKSKTDATRLTALAYNTASLTCHYHRQGVAAEEAVTLADMTLGVFTSGGFKELDATNCPGLYQFCPPDAALATGAAYCDFTLKGAANLAQEVVRIHLDVLQAKIDTIDDLVDDLESRLSAARAGYLDALNTGVPVSDTSKTSIAARVLGGILGRRA